MSMETFSLGRMPPFSERWVRNFLELAAFYAAWSKDPSTKVGAVIVRPDKTQASMGFNGFAKGADDDPAIYADRKKKYELIIHAEANALIHANGPVTGCTLFTWPFAPCIRCAVMMLQAGIRHYVFCSPTDDAKSRWGESLEASKKYIVSCGGAYQEVGHPEDYKQTEVKE